MTSTSTLEMWIVRNLAEDNNSQHPDNDNYRSRKRLSVMFDVWNSTCRLANLQLFANTPDTAVSLIRSSTFVRLIGVSVSDSTNHLCGTSGMRLDWSGSSLLSNCSFSSCVTNANPPRRIDEPVPEPEKEITEITQNTRLSLRKNNLDETVYNQVWIASCQISGMTYSETPFHGAAIYLNQYRADVVIKASSFERCHATYNNAHGGAVFLCHYQTSTASNVYSATLFNCQFTNNTAEIGGHLSTQEYNPVTIAQCTFAESGPRVGGQTAKICSICVNLGGDCRFDNCTLSDNEGSDVGGIEYLQSSSTGKIVLTDVLFDENFCTDPTARKHVTDCCFYYDKGIDNREFYDCFSTSTPIKCANRSVGKVFPDLIGPSIISVGQTIQENANGNGFEIVLSFKGVFTGSSRKYDVTLKPAVGNEIVAEKVSFSKTAGTASVPLNNPSKSYLSPSTTYTIIAVKKSASQSTSNEFIEGGVAEPDWTWWHHTAESRAGKMVGLSVTTPKGPTLTNIKADLNPSNLNEVIVNVTVSQISTGLFTLVVFDSSDSLKPEITIGPISFTLSSTPTTSSHTVLIHPSDELSYGMTYTVKTLSSSTLIVYHTGQTLTMPDAPPRISQAEPTLSGLNKTFVTLSLSGAALPGGKAFGIVVKEMEGNAIKNGASEISLTGTIGGTIGSTETTCQTSVEIYTKTGTLEYSKKYKIISLSIVGFSCIVDATATFEVPDSPGRVEEMMTPKLNGVKTEVSVVVTGVGFASSISKIEVKRGDKKILLTNRGSTQ
ncbi:hypothetical protein BLNAU_1980 [Blattamonas nauphoetae]|uniref:Uncharacterized protein n=1 Tax=Blattamonas nauphoetae TaxID=2049346 RepID=A0ABQ9YGS7_9EUKA|nr:hypothetical protein BLNAU_1980 [Blattamonas nauphoetae]